MSLATSDLHHHHGRLAIANNAAVGGDGGATGLTKPIRKNKAETMDDGSVLVDVHHSKHPDCSIKPSNISASTLFNQNGRSFVVDHQSSSVSPSMADGPCDKISTTTAAVKVASEASAISSSSNNNSNQTLQRSTSQSSSDSFPSSSTTMVMASSSSLSNQDTTNRVFLFDRSNFDHFQEPLAGKHNESIATSPPQSLQNLPREQESEMTGKGVACINDSSRLNRSTVALSRNNLNQSFASDDCCLLEGRKTAVRFDGAYTKKSSSSSISTTTSSVSAGSVIPISSMDDELPSSGAASSVHGGQNDGNDATAKPLSRRQWYQLWLPSYKSRLNQFQRQFSGRVPVSEKLVDDFVCAVHRELLLQGRMYVTVNNITFYSNIFGFETHICIRYKDISSISKASTVKLFPNAIQIITNSGLKYFFTSFVSRERAFRLMTRLWEYARREDTVPWPEIRKLIRESYTTESLGVDLSDIDDADVEIDLSKKSKKKKKKKKGPLVAGINSSSELTNMEDLGDDNRQNGRVSNSSRNGFRMISSSSPSLLKPMSLHNANVQTDDESALEHSRGHHGHHHHNHHHNHHHHDGHKCTLTGCFHQWITELKCQILRFVPTQEQVIRILFLLALILFVVQIGIYIRFTALNQRLLRTQQILFDAMMEQDRQRNWSARITPPSPPPVVTSAGESGFCFMKS